MPILTLVVASALTFSSSSAACWHLSNVATTRAVTCMNEQAANAAANAAALAALTADDGEVAAFAAAEQARAKADMASISESGAQDELRAAGLYDDIEEVMITDDGTLPDDLPFGAGNRKLSLPSMEDYYAGAPGTGRVEWTKADAAAFAEAAEMEAIAAAEAVEMEAIAAAEAAEMATSSADASAGEGEYMQVTCPMELGPERTLRIKLPDEREYDVQVPEDVMAGGEFIVGPFPPAAA